VSARARSKVVSLHSTTGGRDDRPGLSSPLGARWRRGPRIAAPGAVPCPRSDFTEKIGLDHCRNPGAIGQCRAYLSCTPTAQAAGKQKSLHAAERDSEHVQRRRLVCWEAVEGREGRRLQCVDASGATLALTRRYGRATPGQRVMERGPDNYGTTPTMMAALRLNGLDAPWGVDGAITGAEVFQSYGFPRSLTRHTPTAC
jgi:hypothetical protein